MLSDFYLRRPHTNYSPRRLVSAESVADRPLTSSTSRHLLRNCLSKQSFRPYTGVTEYTSRLNSPRNDLVAVEFPSPSSSAYDISLQLPRVSSSGFLSSLTISENERLERKQIAWETARTVVKQSTERPESVKRMQMPSEQDFRLLQDRLEQITSNKGFNQKKSQLKEDRDFESLLPAKEQQFFRVPTKGKPAPLRVMIKRTKGKLQIYSSKSISEPTEHNHDEQHKLDRFTFVDTGPKFKIEQIFIGLQAIDDCFYSIRISFGQATANKLAGRTDSAKIVNKEETIDAFARQELEKRVEEAIMRRAYKAKHTVLDKNYITTNIKQAASIPTLKRQTMSARALTHESRRERAQERKSELLSQKRIRTINSLNRHIIRMHEEKKAKELVKLMRLKQRWQELWLTQTVVAKALVPLNAKFIEARTKLLESKKRSICAMRIQQLFRSWRGSLASDELCLVGAVNCLKFFHIHAKELQFKTVKRHIANVIRESAGNFAVPRCYDQFFKKVVFLQEVMRTCIQRGKEQWSQLVQMWSSKMDDMVKIAESMTKKAKNKKAGKELMKRYMSVAPSLRNQALNTYLFERKRVFKRSVKEYVSLIKQYRNFKLRTAAIKELLKAGKSPLKAMMPPKKPVFAYLPTQLEMAKLIENTVNSNKS